MKCLSNVYKINEGIDFMWPSIPTLMSNPFMEQGHGMPDLISNDIMEKMAVALQEKHEGCNPGISIYRSSTTMYRLDEKGHINGTIVSTRDRVKIPVGESYWTVIRRLKNELGR